MEIKVKKPLTINGEKKKTGDVLDINTKIGLKLIARGFASSTEEIPEILTYAPDLSEMSDDADQSGE